jgi:hypothetical protein
MPTDNGHLLGICHNQNNHKWHNDVLSYLPFHTHICINIFYNFNTWHCTSQINLLVLDLLYMRLPDDGPLDQNMQEFLKLCTDCNPITCVCWWMWPRAFILFWSTLNGSKQKTVHFESNIKWYFVGRLYSTHNLWHAVITTYMLKLHNTANTTKQMPDWFPPAHVVNQSQPTQWNC